MRTVFEAVGGHAVLLQLAEAWHVRVLADDVVSHAFARGVHPDHTERLAAYWGEALGGPENFSDQYGDESSVIRMHSGNGEHEELNLRAIDCFDRALAEIGFVDPDPVHAVLLEYFSWAATTTLYRYHHVDDEIPTGLHVPHWSWDGLVDEGLPTQ